MFVEGDHLAVLDQNGNVTRLPLTGDGAVSWSLALAIGFAVYAAPGGGVITTIIAVIVGLGARFLLQRLLTHCAVRIATRTRA